MALAQMLGGAICRGYEKATGQELFTSACSKLVFGEEEANAEVARRRGEIYEGTMQARVGAAQERMGEALRKMSPEDKKDF
ncbi:MAG: hypothetical protein AB1758_32740, partial [Candidatus Eremiobacterota bacterium]